MPSRKNLAHNILRRRTNALVRNQVDFNRGVFGGQRKTERVSLSTIRTHRTREEFNKEMNNLALKIHRHAR